RAALPSYMVPEAVVLVDAIPLTPRGKLDRSSLPTPAFEGPRSAVVAPRTETEVALAEIWSAVLGGKAVGIDDGFFEAGGNSLLAIRLVSRVRSKFAVKMAVRVVFDAPTIAKMATWLE